MSEVETQVLEESGMSSTAGVGSEVPSENSMVTPMATEGQTSGTDPNLSYGYAQGYSTQANYEIPNNYEENVNYGDYYNYYSNYYQHLQVKGQHYIDPSQTQSAIDSKANTRDLISKALARHQSKADAARDEEEDEEGQIPASPRAFNRTPSSTRGGSAHNSRYSRSRSISRSRSVSKERQLRSRSRSLSPKRYISRSRSRSPRRRHHSRSRSRSPYRGPIIKDYRRGRRGFVRYPRGFRDRGSRPFRRGHSGYTLGYFGHSRRREYSHSRSRSISPKRRYIEIDKIDNSDEERTVDSKNSETLKPSDIKMSEKALTKSFLAMLEEKQKRAKMIPIVAKSETSERDDRRHGFVNTFNSVAGRQSNSDKHTLSYDLESEGWQVVDDANTDSKTVDRSGNEDEDYKEEIIEEFEAEEDQKSVKKSEVKSDSSEEESKSKKKKSKKQKKHKKRKASTSDTSDSDSDNDNTEENEKKRSKKKKKKSKKRKRKDSSSSSSSDDEEKVKKHKKKKKKKKESSSESESEDKKEDNEEITKDQEMKESDANDRVIVETKDLSKTKEKKKKHKSDSSDSDSNKKKKKKKSKKKSSKKRKRRSSSSSSSYSSDSSDSDSKKKKKKKSKKSKSKKHKKKNKDKSKSINDDKKKAKQETTDKDESEIVIVMSVGDPPLQLKWPKKLIKQTHCMPSLEYSINPKVTINQEDFKEIKIRTNSFESNSFKTSGKLVSEYEKFIDELNPNIQCEDPTHEYDSLEHKLRDKLVKNMSERNERQDVMTSSERRALEKLKKQSFHSYNYEDNYRRHDDLKSAPMSAYYSAKVPKSSPLKSNDETETKSNKSNENEIKSSETISLSIEDHSHKHQSFQSEVNKVDDKKLTAQELLERVKQKRHSSKDNKETNNEKERRDLKSKNLPHIGKMKGVNKKKKGSITTANADSTQSAFVSQPMALDMNYDYTWYYNYYMNSVYGVAQYPQVYDPSLASAYYAYYQMVTSNDYSQSDLNEWAKQNGLTITSNVDTNQSDTNLQNKEIELDKDKQQTGLTQTTTDPSAVENKTEYESQENGSTIERKVEQMSDVTTETKQNIENKNIEVLVSIKPSEIPHEESEESKPSPTNTSPFSSTNFQQKVKVRVTASSHTETDSTETDAAPPPPPPPPRPLMTRLISSEPITLPNGQVLPAGTKQVVVHPYHTEDRNKFTTQWFVDAFNGQKTTEGNTQ